MKIVEFYVHTYNIDKIAKALLKENIGNFFIDEVKSYELKNKNVAFSPRFRIFFSIQLKENKDIIKKMQDALAKEAKNLNKSEIKVYILELLQEVNI